MALADSSPEGYKTLWEKDRLLLMSNLSFAHSVLKIFVLQTHKKTRAYFEKG